MDPLLSLLSNTVPQAQSAAQLARPLLEVLNALTGMESTYLTEVDLAQGRQRVTVARNAGTMQIPEGLSVPWEDTLCKRALDEDRMFTNDVPACWGDSAAAKVLGIQTYMSAPVRTQDGRLLGTLCAASASTHTLAPGVMPVLSLFSSLLATFMERESLLVQLQMANQQLSTLAQTDVLTGLPNRRAVIEALPRLWEQARRDQRMVLVGSIDLDGFKAINDTFGHMTGDAFLQAIAQRLAGELRAGDLLSRMGGDEFLLVALAATDAQSSASAQAMALQQRLVSVTEGTYDLGSVAIAYAGASVGVVAVLPEEGSAEAAILHADEAMYRVKAARRAARGGGPALPASTH